MKKPNAFLSESFAAWLLPVAACALAGAGCNLILGLEPGEKASPTAAGGDSKSGGEGGAGGAGGVGGAGGGASCEPGAQEACYDGPAGTEGVGPCKGGTRTCPDDGAGFGPCVDQVLPAADVCGGNGKTAVDGNCNGYKCSETIWGKTFGDAGFQFGERVAADAEGNVVIIGSFEGTADFGGGPLASEGLKDVFVAKYSPDGKPIWSKKFGNQSAQVGNGVAVDPQGNVLVTGSFEGTIDFGGGPLQSAGQSDVFVAKLSKTGDFIWQAKFGDGMNQVGRAITADADGNVIQCGSFQGTMNFGQGSLSSAGDYDIYAVSFDPEGKLRWGKRFGDAAAQNCEGVAVSPTGDVLLTGPFKGTVTFGSPSLTTTGDFDSYVAKFNKDGDFLWSQGLGGLGGQRSEGLAVAKDGNVFITGYMSGDMSVAGSTVTTSGGAADLFVVKLNEKGGFLWGNAYGDASDQFAEGVATDADGNVFVVGYFSGQINFGSGPLIAQGSGMGTDDMYIAKLNTKGAPVWSRSLGDAADQYATCVAVSPSGNLYVGGHIDGSVNLGGGIIKSAGNFDVFLARFEP